MDKSHIVYISDYIEKLNYVIINIIITYNIISMLILKYNNYLCLNLNFCCLPASFFIPWSSHFRLENIN